MYIIVIGWLYIIVLMAATEKTVVAGMLTLVFYGLAPSALFLWLFGRPGKRRRHIAQAAQAESAEHALDEVVSGENGQRPKQD